MLEAPTNNLSAKVIEYSRYYHLLIGAGPNEAESGILRDEALHYCPAMQPNMIRGGSISCTFRSLGLL